jgi:secreted trypsin-like serine protease
MTHFKIISAILLVLLSIFGNEISAKKPSKPKIINGNIVSSSTVFPYQVLFNGGNDGGGTIVAKRWILTAAHIATTGSSLQVYAGVVNRNNLSFGQNRVFKQQKTHPNYNGSLINPINDVALIEVTQPFTYNGSVEAVKLASANNAGLWAIGNQPTVSGFGRTSSGSSLSNELRQVNVQITNVDNTNNKIRAGGSGGNDSCQGDSGGPLSSNNTQIGIVSAGGTCGTEGDYMMVSKYLDFVTQTIHLFGIPDFVCGNTTFENLSKLPDGVSFQWSASPSNFFTINSGSGLTFTTANRCLGWKAQCNYTYN